MTHACCRRAVACHTAPRVVHVCPHARIALIKCVKGGSDGIYSSQSGGGWSEEPPARRWDSGGPFLACRQPRSRCDHRETEELRERGSQLVCPRAPIHRRGPPLLSSAEASYPARRHPQIPSHWGAGRQQVDLGGHTSDPSNFCLKFSWHLPPFTFRFLGDPWGHLLPLPFGVQPCRYPKSDPVSSWKPSFFTVPWGREERCREGDPALQ